MLESDQPYLNSIVILSKKWMAGLPPDLQKIIRDDAAAEDKDIVPFVKTFFAAQRKVWTDHGGVLTSFPASEQAAMVAKISSIGDDLSKTNPTLNAALKVVFASAAKNK